MPLLLSGVRHGRPFVCSQPAAGTTSHSTELPAQVPKVATGSTLQSLLAACSSGVCLVVSNSTMCDVNKSLGFLSGAGI